MENDPDVGLLTCQALYRLPAELEFMDLFSFPLWFGLRTFSAHKLTDKIQQLVLHEAIIV